jgi:drug/metabolite transporter (DMT)-like permease
MGYVVWYAALRGLTATRAGIVQLAVPVIAALGGVLFLSEAVTLRLVLASLAVLGGVALAVGGREHQGR